MDSATPARPERKSSRAGVLLLLYVLTSAGVSRTLADMESLPEKLGFLSIPFALLSAGCWLAFKEGGTISRIFASVLAMTMLGSFGFGLVQGFAKAKGAHEVDRELDQLRAGLIEDSSGEDLGPDAARRHRERTQAAASRMQASGNAETVALGRALESMTELSRESDERLLSALDTIASDRFLSIAEMLATEDFEWQRATAKEYAAAAKASSANHATLPDEARARFTHPDIPPEGTAGLMRGFERNWPLSARVYAAHLRTAKAYLALIDFVELHRAEIAALHDGSLEFQRSDSETDYNALLEQATAADAEVNAAVDALQQAIVKG